MGESGVEGGLLEWPSGVSPAISQREREREKMGV